MPIKNELMSNVCFCACLFMFELPLLGATSSVKHGKACSVVNSASTHSFSVKAVFKSDYTCLAFLI